MKTLKLMLIIIFCFTFNMLAQNWTTHGTVEGGWKKDRNRLYEINHKSDSARYPFNTIYYTDPNNTFYVNIDVSVNYKKWFTFRQQINNSFYYDKSYKYGFTPINIDFISTFSLNYKKISVGYQHSCFHPIMSEILTKDFEIYQRGGTNRVFIKYTW
jgi:hypothetical protein